jgi:hypothetical protein
MVQAVRTEHRNRNAVRPDITRTPAFSVIPRSLCWDFSNHRNKSKNKNIPSSNKICDKLNKMWTFLYVIWFLRASCLADGRCYGQFQLLLSVFRTDASGKWLGRPGACLLQCRIPPYSSLVEIQKFCWMLVKAKTASVVQWSEFLTANPEVLGSISGATKFSA